MKGGRSLRAIATALPVALAFAVEWRVWVSGSAVLAIGLVWHVARRSSSDVEQERQHTK